MGSMEEKVEYQLSSGECPDQKRALIHDEVGYIVLDYLPIQICTDVISTRTAPEAQRCHMRMKDEKLGEDGQDQQACEKKTPESQGYYEAKASGRWQAVER